MRSYWEHKHFLDWDVVVVGAGLVGLSAALAVRARRPKASVLVLERGVLPTGASTRNAGFACFGSLTELLDDVDRVGWDATLALVERRWRGLHALLGRIGHDGADHRPTGGWELIRPQDAGALTRLSEVEVALRSVLGPGAVALDETARAQFGFPAERVSHVVSLPREGSVDSGRIVRSLLRLAGARDVSVWTGAAVRALHEDGAHVVVEVGDDVVLRAGQVVVCTNGFARELVPSLELSPGRGQVLVTEHVPGGVPFSGVFHLDAGYVYFREVDGRVLLGGGRNLDVAGETTTSLGLTQPIQDHLDALLREVVLPGREVAVAHRWAGLMAFGPDKAPIVRAVSERVLVAARLGGMGVALGSLVGDEAAALLD